MRPAPRRPLCHERAERRLPRVIRTTGETAALPLWPVSGLATNRVRLPARSTRAVAFGPILHRDLRDACRLPLRGQHRLARPGADHAPCFPFNRAHRGERAGTKVPQV
jgi:hypothetical protein